MLHRIWIHLIWKFPVGVEPVRVVSGGVSAPLALNKGIDPTYCLYCGLFCHTRVNCSGVPVGIV